MGGDGLKDDAYIAQAGPASEGDLASTVGAPPASIPSASGFLEAYATAGFGEPPSNFGVYAYDAANVLIGTRAPTLEESERVTPAIRRDVTIAAGSADVEGASGRVAFDDFGDTRSKVLTVYRVTDGAWTPVKTETLP